MSAVDQICNNITKQNTKIKINKFAQTQRVDRINPNFIKPIPDEEIYFHQECFAFLEQTLVFNKKQTI
ncbi:hypothetical protein pb186bvf_000193 [Paramecium bursaria]